MTRRRRSPRLLLPNGRTLRLPFDGWFRAYRTVWRPPEVEALFPCVEITINAVHTSSCALQRPGTPCCTCGGEQMIDAFLAHGRSAHQERR